MCKCLSFQWLTSCRFGLAMYEYTKEYGHQLVGKDISEF